MVSSGVNANGTSTGVSKLTALNIGAAGIVDLKDNDLVVDYSGTSPLGSFSGTAYTGLTGKLASAYNYSAWDGYGLTTTMPDALAGVTTLAIAEAADVLFLSGTDTQLWGGQTVDATSLLVKYTYAGDLNLDGLVDATDYGILDNSFQFPGTYEGYAYGDINFDGVIDASDYGILDNSFQVQGPPLTTSGLAGVTAVPEPGSACLLLGLAGALWARRRR
jgi:hypothetical protein